MNQFEKYQKYAQRCEDIGEDAYTFKKFVEVKLNEEVEEQFLHLAKEVTIDLTKIDPNKDIDFWKAAQYTQYYKENYKEDCSCKHCLEYVEQTKILAEKLKKAKLA